MICEWLNRPKHPQVPPDFVDLNNKSVDNIKDHLLQDFSSRTGTKYSTLCHRPPNTSLPGSPCFTDMASLTSRSSVLTLSFVPGSTGGFVDALKKHAAFTDSEFGVKYSVEGPQMETIREMKSSKWIAYAARALVIRFWDLTKVCPCAVTSLKSHDINGHSPPICRKQTHSISCSFSLGTF